MIKKHACYLSIALLAAPLVALADEVPVDPATMIEVALTDLPRECPALAPRINAPAQQLLQAFYQG